ncbi:MAG: LysM peptidoglycan-binding domain-containing protein [Myxococcales bacterium]|nr:LysM peptidoglycan-binding domain-containing protein [Myxococcales bacterium]
MNRISILLLLAIVAASGCDRASSLASSSPRHRLTVISSAPPQQRLRITVTDERYLSDVARRLGTTVETLIRDNKLADSTIHPGMQLEVRTTARRHAEFERLQQVRAERRIKRAEAKRNKAAAAAAAKRKLRKAKRPRRRRARRKKRRSRRGKR